MMGLFFGLFVKAGLSPIAARRVGIAVLIALVIAASFLTWRCVKKDIVDDHDARQEVELLKGKSKADSQAADERGEEVARLTIEQREIREAVEDAKSQGRNTRAAYYECVRLQQDARATGAPVPAC